MRAVLLVFFSAFLYAASIAQPAKASPAPEAFGVLPAVYDASIAPDSSKLAVIININGIYGIMVLGIAGTDDDPKVIRLSEGVKPQWIKWANNERVLLSLWQSHNLGGEVFTSGYIHSLDTNTMKGKTLVKPKRQFRQFNNHVVDFLEDDPDHILMAYSDRNSYAPNIMKVNVATGQDDQVLLGKEYVQRWYTDLRGEPRIGQGRYDRSKEKWYLTIRDAQDNKWREHDEYPGLDADVDIYGFTENLNELIIGAYNGKDTLGLYIYDLSAKKQTRELFHNDKYDVGAPVFSNDGSKVIGATYVADSPETVIFEDEHSGSILEKMRKKYEGYHVKYVSESPESDKMIFTISSPQDPGALMIYDEKLGGASLLSAMRPDILASDIGQTIPVSYTARDGESIPAYVTLPVSITETSQLKNLPFIVWPHGGPYARQSLEFDYFAQFFATRGYGVLQMNFRGSAGYGKTFKEAGRENWVVMQEDVEDGTRWLLSNGYADPDRTCIAGWSYGGYAALMGAINHPDLYARAISMAGVTDLKDMITHIKKYRFGKITAANFVLKGFEDKDDLKINSPVRRADEITVPVFLAHGKDDQRVHFDQYKRMKKALKKSSAKVTTMEFKDEDHFLSNQENRQKFFVGLDKFLRKHVGDSEFETK